MALLNLQGGATAIPAVTGVVPAVPVGVKAQNPTGNITVPKNTITPAQTAQQDFSGKYGLYQGTVYDKGTNTPFSSDDAFKAATGYSSNGQKFDTAYQPLKLGTPSQAPSTSSNGLLPTLAGQNLSNAATSTGNPTPASNTAVPGLYTPPNQGTTGVSQGGLIGNLNANALSNPAYQTAVETYNKDKASLNTLDTDFGIQNNEILSRPEGLSQQTGQQGMLQGLYASKRGALANQLLSDNNLLNAANTSQANTTSGLNAAASANAPITGVPYGTQTIQPSQPNGSTTSGAANLSSLIGTRADVNGKANGEYYNTQTGKGFENAQQLADFVNQQIPGANANAQNVFQILQSQGQSGQNGGALNPINQVSSIAQQVISGQISPSQAYAMGGNVSNWQTLLNQALQQTQPGFDQSAAQAKYDANQTSQGNQAQTVATFKSALQQGQNLQLQLSDLIKTFGLNPNDLNAANSVVQSIAKNTSDARYQILSNYINDVANTYSQILTPPGGSATDTTRAIAASMLNATASGTSLIDTMKSLDHAAQAKIAGVGTPSTTGSSNNSNSSNSLFSW